MPAQHAAMVCRDVRVPHSLGRSCKALGSIAGLRHLIAEDCTQLSSRGIAALTGLTVRVVTLWEERFCAGQ